MMQTWSGWKRFPTGRIDVVDAPDGPGVYEVRHTLTGRVMAFGHSGSVARTIAGLTMDDEPGVWSRLFGRQPLNARVADLEYRTCAAASRADARTAAQRLMGLRQSVWRRRLDIGSAGRLAG
ncbi:MAG TPA: hypothetical protein VFW22_13035 [Pseudolabrys sp.]|nr:hypothetical protein [Pseudolabrys sp.]